MLKLTVAVLAVALAGSASAAGWRSLRIDGSSEAGFNESFAAFQEKLSPVRREVFIAALRDIWALHTDNALAEQREYTRGDFFRQVDGLGYDEVVTFTDPTGETAQKRYKEARDAAYMASRMRRAGATNAIAQPDPNAVSSWGAQDRQPPPTVNGQQVRGGSGQGYAPSTAY